MQQFTSSFAFSQELLKQNAKNLKSALAELGTEITHSTALNLASRGFGFENYNTVKAHFGKKSSGIKEKLSAQQFKEKIYTANEFKQYMISCGFSLEEAQDFVQWYKFHIYPENIIDDGIMEDINGETLQNLMILQYESFIYSMCEHFCDKSAIENFENLMADYEQWKSEVATNIFKNKDFMSPKLATALGLTYELAVEKICSEKLRRGFKNDIESSRALPLLQDFNDDGLNIYRKLYISSKEVSPKKDPFSKYIKF